MKLHTTKRATSAKIKRRPLGTFIKRADNAVNRYFQSCVKCNVEGKRKYQVGMGPLYIGLATMVPPCPR